jgi:hypothetical protein
MTTKTLGTDMARLVELERRLEIAFRDVNIGDLLDVLVLRDGPSHITFSLVFQSKFNDDGKIGLKPAYLVEMTTARPA